MSPVGMDQQRRAVMGVRDHKVEEFLSNFSGYLAFKSSLSASYQFLSIELPFPPIT